MNIMDFSTDSTRTVNVTIVNFMIVIRTTQSLLES